MEQMEETQDNRNYTISAGYIMQTSHTFSRYPPVEHQQPNGSICTTYSDISCIKPYIVNDTDTDDDNDDDISTYGGDGDDDDYDGCSEKEEDEDNDNATYDGDDDEDEEENDEDNDEDNADDDGGDNGGCNSDDSSTTCYFRSVSSISVVSSSSNSEITPN